jgi:hypothetical protein
MKSPFSGQSAELRAVQLEEKKSRRPFRFFWVDLPRGKTWEILGKPRKLSEKLVISRVEPCKHVDLRKTIGVKCHVIGI